MPSRRLEDRIRELCARALFEREPQWSGTIRQLQVAIHEHALRVSNTTMGTVISGQPLIRERRESGFVSVIRSPAEREALIEAEPLADLADKVDEP